MCVVLIEYNNNKVLLIYVYMPVDDNKPNQNIIEYNYVLNDIKTICNSVNAQQVIIGGDLNTDLVREYYCTHALNQFVEKENLYLCVTDECNTVMHTYYSMSCDSRSPIEHFLISEKCSSALQQYDEIDASDNFSDHFVVECVMNINVDYVYYNEDNNEILKHRYIWDKASPDQVQLYSMALAEMLHDINIPHDAAICTNAMVKGMFDTSKETILQSKCSYTTKVDSKTVPDWNEYVNSYF